MSHDSQRERLVREIAESRQRLAGDLSGLGHAVNVRERLQDSVRRHPAWWVGGGLLAGWLVARIAVPSRRSRRGTVDASMATAAKRSLFLGLLGIAGKQILRLSEPALTRLAQQEFDRWTQARPSVPRPESRGPSPDPGAGRHESNDHFTR